MAWQNPFVALEQRLAKIENFLVQILLCEEQILIVQEQMLMDSLLEQKKINALTAQIKVRTAALQSALSTVKPIVTVLVTPLKGEMKVATGNQVIDDFVAALAIENAAVDKAVVYLNGVPALIQAGIDAALAGGATAAQLATLTALMPTVAAEAAAIVAALPPTP